jgi:hypothetical protein
MTTTIVDGWFGAPGKTAKEPKDLWEIWMNSVGIGSGLILNVPPTVTGQVGPTLVNSAHALGAALKRSWSKPVATLLPLHAPNITLTCTGDRNRFPDSTKKNTLASNNSSADNTTSSSSSSSSSSSWVVAVDPIVVFNAVRTVEDIYHTRQSIAKYKIEAKLASGAYKEITSPTRGHTVGVGTIDVVDNGNGASLAGVSALRWTCLEGRNGPNSTSRVTLAGVALYLAMPP